MELAGAGRAVGAFADEPPALTFGRRATCCAVEAFHEKRSRCTRVVRERSAGAGTRRGLTPATVCITPAIHLPECYEDYKIHKKNELSDETWNSIARIILGEEVVERCNKLRFIGVSSGDLEVRVPLELL
ncbi:hypothetical protein EVAR_48324_1 [Eumeta japonica]|uniref:Uncharacterized protein n=1 Tax=Eumeta variegata TaxID=151549 RepID=A0A4C1YL90_EUMVA|nr:hypothetical protein EVAR_48324_1 [Eumeta japonica]